MQNRCLKCKTPVTSASRTICLACSETIPITDHVALDDVFKDMKKTLCHSGTAAFVGDPKPVEGKESNSVTSELLTTKGGKRYVVRKVLDTADQSIIWSADDLAIRREVSMKTLSGDESLDAVRSFVSEARLTGQLQHPAVMPLHELGVTADGLIYYTMRQLHGASLRDVLDGMKEGAGDDSPSLNQLLNVFQTVCDALSFAAERGICRPELMADDVSLGEFGEVLVVNWGKAIHSDVDQSVEAGNLSVILRDIVIATARVNVDGESSFSSLTAVCTRATAGGYHTIRELQDDVSRYQAGLPTHAEGADILRQLRLLVKRHPLPSAMLGIAALMFLGIAFWFGIQLKTESDRLTVELAAAQTHKKEAEALERRTQVTLHAIRSAAPTFMEEARERIDRRDFEGGLTVIDEAIRMTPKSGELHVVRGCVLEDLGRFKEALQAFKDAEALGVDTRRLERHTALCSELAEAETPTWRQLARLSALCKSENRLTEMQRFDSMIGKDIQKALPKTKKILEALGKQTKMKSTSSTLVVYLENGLKIRDLDAVKDLPITHLFCNDRWLSDISALEAMPLTYLYLMTCQVDDLSPIAGTPLQFLTLNFTQVTDLSPLEGMPLRELYLNAIPALEISALKGMPLHTLDLEGVAVNDLYPLQGMPLQVLDLSRTNTFDLKPLSGMPLLFLSLQRTYIDDLTPLKGCPLKDLWLDRTPVTDLSALKGMPLIRLNLNETKVTDLSPLAKSSLFQLRANSTLIADLTPLKQSRLRHLEIGRTKVNDLSPLATLSLKTLIMYDVDVTDVDCLNTTSLESLDVSRVPLKSFAFLKKIKSLRRLIMDGTTIANSGEIPPSVRVLSVNGCKRLSSTEPFKGRTFDELRLADSAIRDLTPLLECTIKRLHLDDEQFEKNKELLKRVSGLTRIRVGNARWKSYSRE